jgi:hypothetical protein
LAHQNTNALTHKGFFRSFDGGSACVLWPFARIWSFQVRELPFFMQRGEGTIPVCAVKFYD